MEFKQSTFSDGLYFYGSDQRIPENGYQWMLNGRTREGNIKPIDKHLLLVAPIGVKQAFTTLGNIKVLFVAGKAYYQLFGTTSWIQIGSFSMSTVAVRLYTCLVPSSVNNFKRLLNPQNNIYADIQSAPNAVVNGSVSGLIVQDGISQPWFIYVNSVNNTVLARKLKTYAQWSNTDDNVKEYVPIGTFMMFFNQKLFIVARDKRSIYQSVSGRPLDFMVNVDSLGNKSVLESVGGADSVSFTFDYDEITGIYPSNATDIFIYTTINQTRLIQLNYNNTIFDEPTYREAVPAIAAGAVNDKSVIEALGDFIGIGRESLVSFNAVQQLKLEAKNSIFSKMLTNVLKDIKQTNKVCIGRFDDYLLFSLQTTFGPIIAIFDVIQNLWVSFDITEAVRVKEFAVLSTSATKEFYCITYDNEVFQLFGDTEDGEVCTFRSRAFCREELREHKSQCIRLSFAGGSLTDKVRVIEYVDEEHSHEVTSLLRSRELGILYPVSPPVIMPNDVMFNPITLDFSKGLTGRKIVFIIIWSGSASLEELELITTDINRQAATKQSAQISKQTA